MTLHSHCTNGLANTSYLVGMMLGIEYLDTDYGPMAGGTAQPPIELMAWFAREMGMTVPIDLSSVPRIDAELRKIRVELKSFDATPDHFGNPWPAEPSREQRKLIADVVQKLHQYQKSRDRSLLESCISIVEDQIMVPQGYPAVDRAQLDAQVPGGMLSNLYNQLKEQGKLELLPKILEEVPRVRKAAGYVPLVTPTSQIVGSQAAFNVMTGTAYSMMTKEFKALMAGRYGRLPGPADPEVLRRVQEVGETICTRRPADDVPEVDLSKIFTTDGPGPKTQRDALLAVLFPAAVKPFFEKRATAKKQTG
jgi:pyruvate/oxaloacetate carboxyltransferase